MAFRTRLVLDLLLPGTLRRVCSLNKRESSSLAGREVVVADRKDSVGPLLILPTAETCHGEGEDAAGQVLKEGSISLMKESRDSCEL